VRLRGRFQSSTVPTKRSGKNGKREYEDQEREGCQLHAELKLGLRAPRYCLVRTAEFRSQAWHDSARLFMEQVCFVNARTWASTTVHYSKSFRASANKNAGTESYMASFQRTDSDPSNRKNVKLWDGDSPHFSFIHDACMPVKIHITGNSGA
jgi:hypothetical protein